MVSNWQSAGKSGGETGESPHWRDGGIDGAGASGWESVELRSSDRRAVVVHLQNIHR